MRFMSNLLITIGLLMLGQAQAYAPESRKVIPSLSPIPVATPTPSPSVEPSPTPTLVPTKKPVIHRPRTTTKPKPVAPTPGPERKSYKGKVWVDIPGAMHPVDVFFKAPQYKGHFGIDYNSQPACGASVRATSNGTVIEALKSGWNTGYGRTVLIDHGDAYTRYAHMESVQVSVGQVVYQGKVIGTVGNTGNSNKCHLHYESFRI